MLAHLSFFKLFILTQLDLVHDFIGVFVQQRHESATEIQRSYRGYLARKQIGKLIDPYQMKKQDGTKGYEISFECPYCLAKEIPYLLKADQTVCGHYACTHCADRIIGSGWCPHCREPVTGKARSYLTSLLKLENRNSRGNQELRHSIFLPPPPAQPTLIAPAAPPAGLHQISILDQFRAQFVPIPAGQLPDGTPIAAMEADRYPVTRELWREIMPENHGIPDAVPEDLRANWFQSPRAPVTHVNWDHENGTPAEVQRFLARLNQREAGTNCTYDLPTDKELWYLIRADVTGQNRDLYSNGVTAQNVNDYLTHAGNSNNQVQPVGHKWTNAFGIELGNVWKISKEDYDPTEPALGRAIRGGSCANDVSFAKSRFRGSAGAGNRVDDMGFALVRTCH